MEDLTQEQIQNSVNAAYDSVSLINELNIIAELSNEEKNTLYRNKEHLKIMMAKEWFFNALTEEQKLELFDICKYE